MKPIRISLVNNDHVVQATKDLNESDHSLASFLRQVREELLAGETGYLEIQGLQEDPITFAITPFE
jgi:hypothetical protein